jgi:hypothetical protein
MYQETTGVMPTWARKTLGCVLGVLLFTTTFPRPNLARSGEVHGGGFHGGFPAAHGGGFHPGFREFHDGGFHAGHVGEFHRFGEFHPFHHHHFRRGFVVVPGFGGWWWGVGWGWPDYYYPDGGYYGNGPYVGYWYYCSDPLGYYPYVTQCNTTWQTVPAT